ncbi:MAG: carbamoyltransferase HypF [archaeon]|nr:carbamoyltransferase HypF [archaeon]
MDYYRIIIKGIVQGVGFRPFIYNLAKKFNVNGQITNKGNVGVELLVFIREGAVQNFIDAIHDNKPEISFIEDIKVEQLTEEEIDQNPNNNKIMIRTSLKIKPSIKGTGLGLTLPPDVAMCDSCLSEMQDSKNQRFHKYPFIACAECGPRYTTVNELPYDRIRTTMSVFPFCSDSSNPSDTCTGDYNDFNNRRFHAQTFSCKKCGPNYFLITDKDKKFKIPSNEEITKKAETSIEKACELIKNEKILAIMGIGGVHLVGLANNPKVVEEMRKRKRERKYKPFAIMLKNTVTAKKYVQISKYEQKLLESYRRPIVLLKKRLNYDLPEKIAPALHNIGIMLPYAGIHYLLFDYLGDIPLIFTSGNVSNLPMAITPDEVFIQLKDLADAYLLHNRLIHQRCDDSVLRVQGEHEKIIRRSRGYVPEYIPLPFKPKIKGIGTLSFGSELNSTGSVSRGYRIFPSQHIGNANNLENQHFLNNSVLHLKNLLKLEDSEVKIIACDMHPLFNSSKLAESFYKRYSSNEKNQTHFFKIQHHFAHAASLMVDNGINEYEPAVIATLDGVGYGPDGNVWGGEIIFGSYNEMKRGPHLSYIPMIGGDRCVTYPARMLLGFLIKKYGINEAKEISETLNICNNLQHNEKEQKILMGAYLSNENVALSSSCGRLLDSVASLLDICQLKTYRGEPAMRLEGVAIKGNKNKYNFSSSVLKQISSLGSKNANLDDFIIPSEDIVARIVTMILERKKKYPNKPLPKNFIADISASLYYSLGKIFARIALLVARKKNIKNIGLSGGVAYNSILSQGFFNTISRIIKSGENFIILQHKNVPPGDAGISIGQTAIAIAKWNKVH